jgi:hypothetical protein
MSRRKRILILSLCTLFCVLALLRAGDSAHAAEAESSSIASEEPDNEENEEGADGDEEVDEDEGLRQRLTEREDKRRPLKPWSIRVEGRPLTISGEWESNLGYLRHRVLGEPVKEPDRLLLEQGLEVEAFYSWGPLLSLFAQLNVVMEEDLLSHTLEEVSDSYVERGEMWLYSENVAGSHVNLEIGRLDFEDERRWWWDEELDAVRVEYEAETFSFELALARELAPSRFDRSDVDPDDDRVLRLIGETSWDWSADHALELFVLYHDDHSPTERPGEVVHTDREDDSDARLTWLGARLMGVSDLGSRGLLGYWLDTVLVRGNERLVEFEEISGRRREVEGSLRRDVSGWGLDAGINWLLPIAWEPRLFAGYAYGSGDSTPEAGTDRSFRQTGLHANEAGFGGVERFNHYGVVLGPELWNIGILTLGAGRSLLESSSLDFVYHHYRLAEPAESLRGSRLDATLDGERRTLGYEFDLVLAIEEWERLEFEFVAAAFRAGPAFGKEQGTWSYGGFFAMRIAF